MYPKMHKIKRKQEIDILIFFYFIAKENNKNN